MKKFISLLIMLMTITSTCLAMSFSQPVELGRIVDYRDARDAKEEYKNSGASYNRNGIARFGEGEDSIWFHYNNAWNYGGKDLNNTFQSVLDACVFTQIKTDSELTLYMIQEYGHVNQECVLLGKRKDGVWVKYFDTRDVTKNYFGKPKSLGEVPHYSKWHYDKDTIIIEYSRGRSEKGEFRFKWDDNAQWFGVEKVVY